MHAVSTDTILQMLHAWVKSTRQKQITSEKEAMHNNAE